MKLTDNKSILIMSTKGSRVCDTCSTFSTAIYYKKKESKTFPIYKFLNVVIYFLFTLMWL